jgi:hypothetical protein
MAETPPEKGSGTLNHALHHALRIAHKPIASREVSGSPRPVQDLLVSTPAIAVNAATAAAMLARCFA